MLNLKSLLKQILTLGIFKSGTTMSGQLKLSYKNFISCGSYASTKTTVPELINEVKMSSGAMGTVSITSNYISNGTAISTGTYEFIYLPHRYGGVNGNTPTTTGETDNCKYGNLILINSSSFYIVNLNNNNVGNGYRIHTPYWSGDAITNNCHATITETTNNYYGIVSNSTWGFVSMGSPLPRLTTINFYVQCKSGITPPTSWQKIGSLNIPYSYFYPSKNFNFSLTNSAGTVIQCYINANGDIYAKGGNAGHGFEGTITFM